MRKDDDDTLLKQSRFILTALADPSKLAAVVLKPKQVALYIENASMPLVIDLTERVSFGRQSARDPRLAPTVSLNIYDAFSRGVSRVHATMYCENGQPLIIDEYSTNGTWLNGRRLAPMTPTPLTYGNELRLSRLSMLVITPCAVPLEIIPFDRDQPQSAPRE